MAQKKGNIEGEDVNLPPNLSYTFLCNFSVYYLSLSFDAQT